MFYKGYKIYYQDVKNSNRRKLAASIKGNLQVIKPNNSLITRFLGKIHKKNSSWAQILLIPTHP